MATSITPLRRLVPEPAREAELASPLERVRDLVLRHAPTDGHFGISFPDLCIYRFSRPTTFRKAATFGVTLGVVLQGTKRVRIGRHELAVDPMRLLVVTRESEHESAASSPSPDRPYVGLSLCFGPERVARALLALAEAGGPTTREAVPAFVMPCDAPIADALERLVRTLDDPLDRKLLAPLAIDEILFRLLRSDAAAAVRSGVASGADAQRILESMQFIRDHHPEKLSVQSVARHVAMSASHFAHRFRAVARVSPMRYLREVRLDRARSLLLEDGARAGDVAAHVGFESPAHFAREFRRRFGVPPSHYLRARSP
jgi:AraC-like DNA-binding protein